jgi:hypothetical protein
VHAAEKYGELTFDDQVDEFLNTATQAQGEELLALGRFLNSRPIESKSLEDWLLKHQETDYEEYWRICALLRGSVSTLIFHSMMP